MSGWRWGLCLTLGTFLLLGAGAIPVMGNGVGTSTARYGSDYRQFGKELQSGGAFKFMEDTEDLLRAGQFENAFSRYLFLKAHIRGQGLYTGLNTAVDQRLQFLRSQLHLGEIPSYAVPYQKLKRRVKRGSQWTKPPDSCGPDQKDAKTSTTPAVIPAAAKAEDQESQATKTSSDEKPSESILPPSPPPDQVEPQPKGEEAQEEKPKEKEPAPAPSYWDKIKRRLKFW